jgi:hypothetical protein
MNNTRLIPKIEGLLSLAQALNIWHKEINHVTAPFIVILPQLQKT